MEMHPEQERIPLNDFSDSELDKFIQEIGDIKERATKLHDLAVSEQQKRLDDIYFSS